MWEETGNKSKNKLKRFFINFKANLLTNLHQQNLYD